MFLKKNGAAVSTGSTSKDDAFQGIFGTAILNLVAGDQVKFIYSEKATKFCEIFP